MSERSISFRDRLHARGPELSPAEMRVAQYLVDHREGALVRSAAAIAAEVETSDATVVRTAKSLGFQGLDDLRRQLAEELSDDLTPASRVARTIGELGDDLSRLFHATLELHRQSLDRLERQISGEQFAGTVRTITGANRVAIFGIGPSSSMAAYFAVQARRLGLVTLPLVHTGLLLADDLSDLAPGDVLVILAYGRAYPELTAMVRHAGSLSIPMILLTDTLGPVLGKSMKEVLNIPRGRSDLQSMHTATLAFIEALLVAIAAERPAASIASLETLNRLRGDLAGGPMNL